MFAFQSSRVQLLVVLMLLLHYCSADCAEGGIQFYELPKSECEKYSNANSVASGLRVEKYGDFPHMAAIGWSQQDGTIIWQCGGSLIWDNYILTAAHCAVDRDNNTPDIVRLGKINLYGESDNHYLHERKIVEIIRHPDHRFSKRYHDIALMRLETKVSFDKTVSPACLWNDDEFRFKKLEATGWGDTGFAEKGSSILMKVSLSPMDQMQCRQYYLTTRGLPDGLHASQMCAGDVKMDTCPGDSGGPLEVKLLHNRCESPFIIAITSFGSGQGVPGVYTRVAPYIPWIRSVLNDRGENATEGMFQPQACALRYAKFRKTSYYSSIVSRYHATGTVSIHWDGTNSTKQMECFGVVIDESTIVTLARCTSIDGIPPSHVRYGHEKTNSVTNYFRHPQYEENSLYNDIGLLKLKDPVTFSHDFHPAYPWHEKDSPEDEIQFPGRGNLASNVYLHNLDDITPRDSDRTVDVVAFGESHIGPRCSLPAELTPMLEKGLTEEHFCYGYDHFQFPGACDQSLGGPIASYLYALEKRSSYIYALNLFGRGCGYGESAVGVKIGYHMKWIQSILQPKEDKEDPIAPLVFLHSELKEGDRCAPGRGTNGICVQARYCPKVWYQFQTDELVRFCQTGSLVCCPQEFVRNETDAEWKEIDQCENLHGNDASEDEHLKIQIEIFSKTETGEKTCTGTIITSQTIAVAANCVSGVKLPTDVSLKRDTPELTLTAERITIHPEFDRSTMQHNLALIHIKERFNFSAEIRPACLWRNTTIPQGRIIQTLRTNDSFCSSHGNIKYSIDCERFFDRVLQPHELCLKLFEFKNFPFPIIYPSKICVTIESRGNFEYEDAPATILGPYNPYLVGMSSQKSADDSNVFLHTRVSSYVSWIKSVL